MSQPISELLPEDAGVEFLDLPADVVHRVAYPGILLVSGVFHTPEYVEANCAQWNARLPVDRHYDPAPIYERRQQFLGALLAREDLPSVIVMDERALYRSNYGRPALLPTARNIVEVMDRAPTNFGLHIIPTHTDPASVDKQLDHSGYIIRRMADGETIVWDYNGRQRISNVKSIGDIFMSHEVNLELALDVRSDEGQSLAIGAIHYWENQPAA